MSGTKRGALYVGCALTHAPQEFRDEVRDTKEILRKEHGIDVLEFVGLEGGTEEDVYRWDVIECVGKCSAFVGVYGYPGDGLGYETAVANARGIPRLGVAHKDAKVSRLITGSAMHHGYPFIRYEDMRNEVPLLVVRHFVELQQVL